MTAWLAYAVHIAATLFAAFAILRRRTGAARLLSPFEIAAAAATAGALLVLTSGPVFIDFIKAYHHAGQAILTDPASLYDCTRAQCFVNVPIVALLFTPFAPFDPISGAVAFSVVGLVAVGLALRRLTRNAPADAVVWMVLLSGPLYYSVRLGNTTHFLLLLFLVAFEAIADGRDRKAGALLAFAALIKPPLAIFLPYLLLRRRFGAAAAMAGWAAAALVLSVVLFGVPLHLRWFHEFVIVHGSEAIGAYNVQSAGGALGHLLTRGHLRDWYPIAVGLPFRLLRWAIVLLLLGPVAAACRRAGRPRTADAWEAELSLVLTAGILVAPIAWTHYYLLLLIPMTGLLAGRLPLAAAARPVFAAAAWLISLPVVVFGVEGRIANALYERLLVSHFFAGGVLLLGLLIAARLAIAKPDREGRAAHLAA